jgi:hypothetical protein
VLPGHKASHTQSKAPAVIPPRECFASSALVKNGIDEILSRTRAVDRI